LIIASNRKSFHCIKLTKKKMKKLNGFLPLLILFLLFVVTYGNAQNFSGLKDKQLNSIADITAAITGLFSSKVQGDFSAITVTYDSENKLKLKIDYTGFETAYIAIAVQDNQKKGQQLISKEAFSLEGKTSPLEVILSLNESASEGTALESTYLEIKIAKKKGSFPKIILYSLNKKWQKEINAENLVIPITLEPVGSAADLKESNQILVKPKIKPTFKIAKVNPAIFKTSTSSPVRTPITRTTTPTSSKPKNINGTWINNDKNTKGITKIIISNNGKKIRVYGKCSPTDCDWGSRTLSAAAGSKTYSATFNSSIATSYLKLKFTTDLKLSHNRVYKKGNKKVKKEAIFKKQVVMYTIYTPIKTIRSLTTTTNPSPNNNNTSTNIEPQGPDNYPISLWDDLVADNNFEFPYEITNIRMDIYPDKNLKSGVFYYLPNAYHLRWNADEGYQFRMLYGTGDDASSGNVKMSGTLTPGIGNSEVALMKILLQSYTKNNPIYTYKELKIIPIKSKLKISLSSGLEGQYNIPADKIDVTVQSTITAPIEISWVTDNRTKEEMQVALSEGVGINGAMTLVPNSETIPEQPILVRIALSDARTLGRFILEPNQWRTKKWTNNTPYPLKLKFIHALVIEKEGNKSIPLIYSWSLGNTEVLSKAKVDFDANKMPEWLENKNKIERLWIDYTIVDCETCVNKVMDELTGGTSGSKIKNITMESFQVFEKLDAALLRVKIRSKQADPKRNTVVELSAVRIEEDLSTYSTGPLYVPEGANAEYEYFFTLVMSDGVSYNSDDWTPSNEQELFIGLHTLKEAISGLSEIIDD
jgi:hypothetical protein